MGTIGDSGQLSYVKKVIHSLLISTPQSMTIESLKRDYHREEGIGVPFGRMGFRDIESFLRHITDTVLVVGNGPMARLFPVSNVRTAHIQHLVQCQKKQSNKPRNRRRAKPKYIYRSEPSDLVFINEKPRQEPSPMIQKFRTLNTENKSMAQYYDVVYQRSNPLQSHNYEVNEPKATSNPIEAQLTTKSLNQMIPAQKVTEDTTQDIIKENCISNEEVQWDEDQSDDDQSNDDLCDKEENHIQEEEDIPDSLQREFFEPDYNSTDEGIDEDPIPAYAIDEHVINLTYPRTAVRSDYELPERNLEDSVGVGERLQVQLVKVENPHSFKFWLLDDSNGDYIAMSNNMQKSYNDLKSLEFIMPLFLITTGHLCVIRCNATWERARVVNHKPENSKKTIEVELIDTGRKICVCPKDVHYLFKDFAILPPQCLPGRLAYVTPWKGSAWSAEAVQSFFQLVDYRILYAKVEQIENNSAYLLLVDPETELKNVTKNVNVRFIESGWARRCYTP